jgi:hypothetical protein
MIRFTPPGREAGAEVAPATGAAHTSMQLTAIIAKHVLGRLLNVMPNIMIYFH